MAPKKSKAVSINPILLQIDAATKAGGTFYVSAADGQPLKDAGLIEVNITMLDANNNAAARLTAAGEALVAGNAAPAASNPAPSAAPVYALISGAIPPVSKRGNKAGAPTQYPFDTMEVGISFFVPVSDKHSDPVKSLGSTVSSFNQKYAVKTGQTKTVERTKRGEGNKAMLDAAGNKVKETVTVDEKKFTRKWSVKPVKAGVAYGSFTPTVDGALVTRDA